MRHTLYILIAATIMGLFACNKFLDIKPKGEIIPKKIIDYERILNDRKSSENVPEDVAFLTDDLNVPDFLSKNESIKSSLYFWEEYVDMDIENPPFLWGFLYERIYDHNVIIDQVLASEGGTENKKKSIRAEALVSRAELNFLLMSYFSPIYDAATAVTDHGIPMLTSIDISDAIPPRSTVTQCMNSIINDIKNAIPALPEINISNLRPSKYAAYGLLSRVYLCMYDYNQALKYADSALMATHQILNYNNGYPPRYPYSSTEQLWVKFGLRVSIGSGLFLSEDLLSYLDASDLRYAFFVKTGRYSTTRAYSNTGISFSEIYLTKAECLARKGSIQESLNVLNEFRKNRIQTWAYVPLSATTANETIDLVLAERRREAMFKPLRWMDMRRLSKDGRMKEVVHGIDSLRTTLPAGSFKYALQIPVRVQMHNADVPLNKR